MTDEAPKKRWKQKMEFTPLLSEAAVLAFIGFIIGAISIDMRVIVTSLVFLAMAILGTILRRLWIISNRMACTLLYLTVPVMVLFWIGLERVQDWRVVPTIEYVEDDKWFSSYSYRNVKLDEPPALRLEPDFLRIDGATSLYDLYWSYAQAVYGGRNATRVESSRTPYAYASLMEGGCDLVFAFRPSEDQISRAKAIGKEFSITPIGYDAFVFFVNADNPVDTLTIRQLKDAYTGKLVNWREAGGDNAAIIPFQRYAGSGSQSRMERLMAGEKLLTPDKEHRFRYMRGIVAHIARYKNYRHAIGYSYLYYVNVMLEGGGVKLLGVDGVMPSPQTLRDGAYPLSEEICIVTAGSANPHVEPFIEWVLSPQGQTMLETLGFVPIRPAPEGPGRPKVRLDEGRREGSEPAHMRLP